MSAILLLLEIWFVIIIIAIVVMSISRILDTYEDYGDNN